MKKGSTKIDIKNERERVNDLLKVVHIVLFFMERAAVHDYPKGNRKS